jgi:hypothetical protein
MTFSTLKRGNHSLHRSRMNAKPHHPISSRAGMVKELDRLTSLIVRKRDGCCLTCGTTENLECSHFYKRRWLWTRFDLTNCNAMCHDCNGRHNVDPFPYLFKMQERCGKDAVLELLNLRNTTAQLPDDRLQSLIVEYRQMLKGM